MGRLVRWCRRNPRLAAVTAVAAAIILTLVVLYERGMHRQITETMKALGREKEAVDKAENALAESEKNAAESRQRLVRLYVSNGVRLMEEGDFLGSLPWLTEALKLDQGNVEREKIHRLRLASVLHRCPKLTHVWFHEGGVARAEFSPDGRHVVTAGSR